MHILLRTLELHDEDFDKGEPVHILNNFNSF
jgi:hypothetical protein